MGTETGRVLCIGSASKIYRKFPLLNVRVECAKERKNDRCWAGLLYWVQRENAQRIVGCTDCKDDCQGLTGWNATSLGHKMLAITVDAT